MLSRAKSYIPLKAQAINLPNYPPQFIRIKTVPNLCNQLQGTSQISTDVISTGGSQSRSGERPPVFALRHLHSSAVILSEAKNPRICSKSCHSFRAAENLLLDAPAGLTAARVLEGTKSILISSVLKTLVLKYGGGGTYRIVQRWFIGPCPWPSFSAVRIASATYSFAATAA